MERERVMTSLVELAYETASEPISKSLPSSLRGQLKSGIKPLYAQPSHGQVPQHKMNARILAARNGQMAGRFKEGSTGREQWKMAGVLQRGTSRRPGSM
jgi:hypothetical protein